MPCFSSKNNLPKCFNFPESTSIQALRKLPFLTSSKALEGKPCDAGVNPSMPLSLANF